MKKLINIVLLVLIAVACSTEPQKIDFGNENCDFCTMTISDDRFASQLVLETGKAFKFCSIECLVRDYNRNENYTDSDVNNYYVMDMSQPNTLIPVSNVMFLVSEKIQSPMGANLAAFENAEKAKELQKEWDGVIYNWEELKTKFQ
jgi:copper chaperone NosL